MKTLHVISIALLVILVACGGSNSGSLPATPVPTPQTAHGVYVGTVTSGNAFDNEVQFQAVILPNDEFYAVYSYQYYAEFMIGQGTSKSAAGTYTVSGLKDYSDNQYPESLVTQYSNGTITGSLKGDSQVEGAPLTFTGSNPAGYDFHTPASLTNIAGAWEGGSFDGSMFQVNVKPDGTFSDVDQGDAYACHYTGTVTPDSSHNFYRVSMMFDPGCNYTNQAATGIAVRIPSGRGFDEPLVFLKIGTEQTVFAGMPFTP